MSFAAADEAALDAAEEGEDEEAAEKALTEDSATLLYQTCQLESGFALAADSATEFADRLQRLVRVGLGAASDAAIKEVEVEIPDDPEPEPEAEEDEGMDLDMDAPEVEII